MICQNPLRHTQAVEKPCMICMDEKLNRIEKMLETLIRRTAPSEYEIAETLKFRESMSQRQFQGMKP